MVKRLSEKEMLEAEMDALMERRRAAIRAMPKARNAGYLPKEMDSAARERNRVIWGGVDSKGGGGGRGE